MTIKEFLGKVRFDAGSGFFFGVRADGHNQPIAEIRGWGAIQNAFREEPAKAEKFQDDLGEWIAEAINEKLEREKI